MALQFGFDLYHGCKGHWSDKFDRLSDDDKGFYHNSLPWLLMAVEVSHVSERTIPEIVKRHKLNPILDMKTWPKDFDFGDYLKKFTGFQANVHFTTDANFLKKVGRMAKLEVKGRKFIDKEQDKFIDELKNPQGLVE